MRFFSTFWVLGGIRQPSCCETGIRFTNLGPRAYQDKSDAACVLYVESNPKQAGERKSEGDTPKGPGRYMIYS